MSARDDSSPIRFASSAMASPSENRPCLLIAAKNITLGGTTNMSTFCPSGMEHDDEVSSGKAKVKLVA